ncbi:hypothetical protein DL762_002383 [Monosporascus cannonballus]|uniref:L-2-hydroxyglutarate dehydrogenase, mitochondrial n=1 Tax=Monosporascus cannonballus TaxID=155416 RepID=A0ABY0HDL9_9PEZI|nr:hypothetical protein DL762_002383 [Monosporascus cannonballus]RYO99211.1 hypothetical protein DL763_001701 [Monosporascus cannonballus]
MLARFAPVRGLGFSSFAATSCPRRFSSTARAQADFTHVVIGGGVIGLAIARALAAQPGSSTLLVERHGQVGTETSSRNSEVIHAGLYYGPGTLKTRLCVEGRRALYRFCADHGVAHRRTGKWIVAQDAAELEALGRIRDFCRAHNAEVGEEEALPVRFVGREEARRLEPDVRADAGILESPTTGIVDSHGLMLALQGLFEDAGGVTALNSEVVGVEPLPAPSPASTPGSGGWRVTVRDPGAGGAGSGSELESESTITAETVINSAGLGAAAIHNMVAPAERHVRLHYAKGNYFSYGASAPRVGRLIYPAPAPGGAGLGTHLTLDLAGRVRFGPDVEWVGSPGDLAVSAARLAPAVAEIRRYLPGVDASALAPDYAGVRPKLAPRGAVGAGGGFRDFYVKAEEGFAGWVNLLGMESPGLTSCLAVADYVRDLLHGSRSGPEVGRDGGE